MKRTLKCFGTVAMAYRVPEGVPVNHTHSQYRFIVWATSRNAAVAALNRCGIRYTAHEAANHMGVTGNPKELATKAVDGAVYVAPLHRTDSVYVRWPE